MAQTFRESVLARFEMIKLEELISAEQHPAVAAYYARMKARPTFKSAVSNPSVNQL